MIWKIPPLWKFEIFGVFVNTLTADDKYPVLDCESFQFPIQMQFLKNKNLFLNLLFHSLNLHQILNIFEKKMIIIGNVFPKLHTVKDVVQKLSWKHFFRISSDSQHVNGCQTLAKSQWELIYHIFWSLWEEMIWKISPLLKVKILDVFVNTLATEDTYPVRDCENLLFPIQMELS